MTASHDQRETLMFTSTNPLNTCVRSKHLLASISYLLALHGNSWLLLSETECWTICTTSLIQQGSSYLQYYLQVADYKDMCDIFCLNHEHSIPYMFYISMAFTVENFLMKTVIYLNFREGNEWLCLQQFKTWIQKSPSLFPTSLKWGTPSKLSFWRYRCYRI